MVVWIPDSIWSLICEFLLLSRAGKRSFSRTSFWLHRITRCDVLHRVTLWLASLIRLLGASVLKLPCNASPVRRFAPSSSEIFPTHLSSSFWIPKNAIYWPFIRGAMKNSFFYGQADHKGWQTNPPLQPPSPLPHLHILQSNGISPVWRLSCAITFLLLP